MSNDTLSSSSDKNKTHPSSQNQNNHQPSAYDRINHCPECGYSLQGLPDQGHCPECGWEYHQSTRVYHFRHSKLQLVLAILTLLFATLILTDILSQLLFARSLHLLTPISFEFLAIIITWGFLSRGRFFLIFSKSFHKTGSVTITERELIFHNPSLRIVRHINYDDIEKVRITGRLSPSASIRVAGKLALLIHSSEIQLNGLFKNAKEVEQFTKIVNEKIKEHQQENKETS